MSSETNGDHKPAILNWVAPNDKSGEFKRKESKFRNWIKNEQGAEFPAEKDRYHLYVSYACPWGWRFATSDENEPGENVTPDPLHKGYSHLRDIYFESDSEYDGRFTVPTLYDKKQKKIVSNESSEIIRMLYHVFDDLLPTEYKQLDLYPTALRQQIDSTNEWTYNDINNGVYGSGFATTEEAYEKAVTTLFKSLDRVEQELRNSPGPYYHGSDITEADIQFATLEVTDLLAKPVYVQHFKCNIRDIRSGYPAIHKWLRKLYWNVLAFRDTTEFTHIKKHYTKSHRQINQFSITPKGPEPNILPEDEEVPSAMAMIAGVR
ncbi:MAG: S-glutathionyl-(chloro)hydroquinone reductase [Chrysothrix sp. TS-e1954]|nr:MAG: S-glutathionyl-(chloro)hydroquinone reductase [Chrysothrix sp. TS-e1954]